MKLNNEILKAISEGLQNALEFSLDDFNDKDEDLYIKKKKKSIEDLEREDDELYYKPILDKIIEDINIKIQPTKEEITLLKTCINKNIYRYKISQEVLNAGFINKIIKVLGNKANLNWIDTSEIIDMSYVFNSSKFNGNISNWNVFNVKDMSHMFENSKFNGNISNWNVSNVTNMKYMFSFSDFNRNLSRWDVSKVINMSGMFEQSDFSGNISNWNISNVKDMSNMFRDSKFNSDISNWDLTNSQKVEEMFVKCPIQEKYKPKMN